MAKVKIVLPVLLVFSLGVVGCSKSSPSANTTAADPGSPADDGADADDIRTSGTPVPNRPVDGPLPGTGGDDVGPVFPPPRTGADPDETEDNMFTCQRGHALATNCKLKKKDLWQEDAVEPFSKLVTFRYALDCDLLRTSIVLVNDEGRGSTLNLTAPGEWASASVETRKVVSLKADEARLKREMLRRDCSFKIEVESERPADHEMAHWKRMTYLAIRGHSLDVNLMKSTKSIFRTEIRSADDLRVHHSLVRSVYEKVADHPIDSVLYAEGPQAGQLRSPEDMPEWFQELARTNEPRAEFLKTWVDVKALGLEKRDVLRAKESSVIEPALSRFFEEEREKTLAEIKLRRKYESSMDEELVQALGKLEKLLSVD